MVFGTSPLPPAISSLNLFRPQPHAVEPAVGAIAHVPHEDLLVGGELTWQGAPHPNLGFASR